MLKKEIDPERIPFILAKANIVPEEDYLMVRVHGEEADIAYSGTAFECMQWYSDNFVGMDTEEREEVWTHMMSEEDYATLDITTLDK